MNCPLRLYQSGVYAMMYNRDFQFRKGEASASIIAKELSDTVSSYEQSLLQEAMKRLILGAILSHVLMAKAFLRRNNAHYPSIPH